MSLIYLLTVSIYIICVLSQGRFDNRNATDPLCENGLMSNTVCCHIDCQQCGLIGCSEGNSFIGQNCCKDRIREQDLSCDFNEAPCVLNKANFPPGFFDENNGIDDGLDTRDYILIGIGGFIFLIILIVCLKCFCGYYCCKNGNEQNVEENIEIQYPEVPVIGIEEAPKVPEDIEVQVE